MKRTPIKKTRSKPRTTKTVRCKRQRCSRAVVVAGLCKTHTIDQLDSIVRHRAYEEIPECSRCGRSANLQWSHHLSRKFMHLRWDPRNYTCHDRECHAWLTHNPFAHVEWIKDHIGVKQYDLLYREAYIDPQPFKTQDLIEAWERLA